MSYRTFALALCLVVCSSERSFAQSNLQPVSYQQLTQEVKAHPGKILLVDVWAEFCLPCKQKFPHVMSLYRKYQNQGLDVVTVSLDDPNDAEAHARASAFLRQQQSQLTVRNLLMKDSPGIWQPKWKTLGPPVIFLFDETGHLVERYDGSVDFARLDQRIEKLLRDRANTESQSHEPSR